MSNKTILLTFKINNKVKSLSLSIYEKNFILNLLFLKKIKFNKFNYFSVISFTINENQCNSINNSFINVQKKFLIKEISFYIININRIHRELTIFKKIQKEVEKEKKETKKSSFPHIQKQMSHQSFNKLVLSEILIRPTIEVRKNNSKSTGILEVNNDSFRYTASRGNEIVYVSFSNIKHAFFQPANKQIITLIHLHLFDNILVGNKETIDLQFYKEIIESAQSFETNSITKGTDSDELIEEENERLKIKRINREFKEFTKNIQKIFWVVDFSGHKKTKFINWDIPYRPLTFDAVIYKKNCKIIPTKKCLIELLEFPFLVITLEEIEIVNMERALLNLKYFDMVFVKQDLRKDVLRIEGISKEKLDLIKEWLKSIKIKFYESKANLNWKQILKVIKNDPYQFKHNGGWEFLNLEATDSEEDKEKISEFLPQSNENQDETTDNQSISVSYGLNEN